MGGVTAFTAQSGTTYGTAPFAGSSYNATVINTVNTTPLSIDQSYFEGGARVVAQGFEVVNTTSQLNVQGQVITYRQPQSFGNGTHYPISDTGITTIIGGMHAKNVQVWPGTPADAMLLAGSRQWHAKEGVYSTGTLNNVSMPCQGLDWTSPIIENDQSETGVDSIAIIPAIVFAGAAHALVAPSLMPMNSYNMNGALFTGLSLQTTLQLTTNVYVERFPGIQETDLVVLAQPSPQYDPMALELYSQALHDMPPGVMVRENGFGDWFMDVVSKISSFVSPLLTGSGNPLATAVGTMLPALTNGMQSFISAPNSKVKKQRSKPPNNNVARAQSQGPARQPKLQNIGNYAPVRPSNNGYLLPMPGPRQRNGWMVPAGPPPQQRPARRRRRRAAL